MCITKSKFLENAKVVNKSDHLADVGFSVHHNGEAWGVLYINDVITKTQYTVYSKIIIDEGEYTIENLYVETIYTYRKYQ